jgi:hypothetical protein
MAIKIAGTTVINNSQKILQPGRIPTSTSVAGTLSINTDNADMYIITAQLQTLTISVDAGTTQFDGQKLLFRIKDSGTSRNIIFAAGTKGFTFADIVFPANTFITWPNKTAYIGCIYNATDSAWQIVSCTQEL